ncbi:hypothetical protein [Knoellia flava]|uniref:Uncharacterized protein n=1 Tax=Knoellia flava TaxID=913969 RepID=A0A8H9FUH8_9MICO|nr:hypothetical protein [Knoellia flava]GGB77506.1 hypothetical protein GCM10011314_16450 [Knoellia flava]
MKRTVGRAVVAVALGLLALVTTSAGQGTAERADDSSVVVAVPPGWRWGTG